MLLRPISRPGMVIAPAMNRSYRLSSQSRQAVISAPILTPATNQTQTGLLLFSFCQFVSFVFTATIFCASDGLSE